MDHPKILLIGVELDLLKTLRWNLEGLGYKVWIARDDVETYQMTEKISPDLLVLNSDFGEAAVYGLEICVQLRSLSQAPLIVISSNSEERQKIQAFDFGADSYLVMPFSMGEFLARVRSALRRWAILPRQAHHPEADTAIIHGDLKIWERSRRIGLRGKLVRLSPTELVVILCLVQGNGKVVTHEELFQSIWGSETANHRDHLRVYVSQIRHKIEDDWRHPVYIQTVPGQGYRLASGTISDTQE